MRDDDRTQVLLEDMNGKFDAIMEYVSDIPVMKEDIAVLKDDVAVLKEDVAVLKTDVAILKTDVGELKSEVVEIKEEQRLMRTALIEDSRDVERLKVIHPNTDTGKAI